jgi:chorismate dehydratase
MQYNPLRITTVSYLNTIPMVYGLSNSGILKNHELALEVPSICAAKLLKKQTDIALVPVGVMIQPEHNLDIITQFCIGSNGKVKTVLLLSHTPLHQIKRIYLDTDSRTSVMLVKVLAKFFWNIKPEWYSMNDMPLVLQPTDAMVAIGDKTFNLSPQFEFVTDLSEAWYQYTSLPFVFAVWATNKPIHNKQIDQLNEALSWGIARKREAIDLINNNALISKEEALNYLSINIDFLLDPLKMEALQLFISKARAL